MWLQFLQGGISRVAIQSPKAVRSLWQHGGGGGGVRHHTTSTTLSATLAREHQQRLLLLTTGRGRRFSVHQAEKKSTTTTTTGGSKRPIKQPEELSKLLLEHPVALEIYLEKISSEQRSEIYHLLRQQPSPAAAVAFAVPEPSRYDLRLVAINTAIPFVGFGIMDNSILIIAGDAIDTRCT